MTAVRCGLPAGDLAEARTTPAETLPAGCDELLRYTYRPAASLWCPVHGHVVDAPPPPPLRGLTIVCGPDGCADVDLATL